MKICAVSLVQAVRIMVILLWTQAPCCLREVVTLIKEAAGSSEISVYFYQATRRHIREDSHLTFRCFIARPKWSHVPRQFVATNQCTSLNATLSKLPYNVATQLVQENGIRLNCVHVCVAADVSGPSHLTGRSLE